MSNGVFVTVGVDTRGLRTGFAQAGQEVQQFGQRMQAQMASMQGAFAGLAKIAAGLAAFKLSAVADEAALLAARLKDVTGSAKGAAEAQALLFDIAQNLQVGYADLTGSFARMLPAITAIGGGTAEAAKLAEILATTARLSGSSTAEASASAIQFAQALGSGVLQGDELRSIMENNQALARALSGALGVTVGELKKMGTEGKLTSDIIANALLGQYAEIRKRANELPNTVGGAWTRITNEFQKFVASVEEGTSAFSGIAAFLNEIAKLLAAVTVSFRDTGTAANKMGSDPTAINWARKIVETFAGIVDMVRLVKQAFVSVGRDLGAIAAAVVQAVQGNFSGAMTILKQRSAELAEESKRMRDFWMGEGNSLLGALRNPEERKSAANTPTRALKGKPVAEDDKKKKAEAEPSFMSYYEAALEEEKNLDSQKDALREFSKQKELAYWQQLLQYAQLSTSDRLSIAKKVTSLEVEIRREGARQQLDLDAESIRSREALQLAGVQTQRAAAQLMFDDAKLTKEQFLALELKFQSQIYAIQTGAVRERMKLAEKDPMTSPVEKAKLNNELLALEGKFQQDRLQILSGLSGKGKGSGTKSDDLFKGMANSFGQSLEYMLLRAKSFSDALRTLWNGAAAVFLRVIVTEPLGQWLAAQAKMLAAKLGFVAQEKVIENAASAATVKTKTGEAGTVIAAEGAKAGAGAAASQASIPIVGPALALAALATVFATVMALKGKLKSAAKGYDIPSGVNPQVQLHEQEMVLPNNLAQGVRELVANGGQGMSGSRGGVNVTVQAMDSKDVKRFLERHASDLTKLSKMQRRSFAV